MRTIWSQASEDETTAPADEEGEETFARDFEDSFTISIGENFADSDSTTSTIDLQLEPGEEEDEPEVLPSTDSTDDDGAEDEVSMVATGAIVSTSLRDGAAESTFNVAMSGDYSGTSDQGKPFTTTTNSPNAILF